MYFRTVSGERKEEWGTLMNQTQTLIDKRLAAVGLAALAMLQASQGWAAAPGALPWDYTLNVAQDFMTGPAADFLIVASLISAGILFAAGGHAARAGCLAALGIATYLALHALHLIDYVLP
jgi:type IV secretory pathway VirB2 component (pilin)